MQIALFMVLVFWACMALFWFIDGPFERECERLGQRLLAKVKGYRERT